MLKTCTVYLDVLFTSKLHLAMGNIYGEVGRVVTFVTRGPQFTADQSLKFQISFNEFTITDKDWE